MRAVLLVACALRNSTVELAVGQLPAHAQALMGEALRSKDAASSQAAMAELSELYASAMREHDDATIKCKASSDQFSVELRGSQDALSTAERLAQGSEARLGQFQAELERAQVDVETYVQKHQQLAALCATKHQQAASHLAALMEDQPLAHELVATSSAACGSASGPMLLECKVDGHRYTTFSEAGLRELAAKLSVPSEQLAALALKRTASAAVEHVSFLQGGSRKFLRTVRRVREESCEEIAVQPKCESLKDMLYTFYGNVLDAADEVREKMATADQHCERTLADYNSEAKQAKTRADQLNIELANAAASKIDSGEDRDQKKRFHDAAQAEASTVLNGCQRAAEDAQAVMTAIQALRPALLSVDPSLGPYEGDCEVSEWIAEPCSMACGQGGQQVLSREIISMPNAGLCPALNRTQPCNNIACPVDCEMGAFGPWSACSRPCDSGTRQRTRQVLTPAAHAGAACGDVLEQEVCNPQPCKTDCLLSAWTEWSGCSRGCGEGYQHRTRKVLEPAQGGGCAAENDPTRYEATPCESPACSDTAKCASTVDVVVLVDGSGSVGADGLAAEQKLVDAVGSRLGDDANIGVVVYGSSATIAAPLGSFASVALTGDFNATDLAQGVAVARQVLSQRRPDAAAKLLIMLDGMPMSKHLAAVELGRVAAEAEVGFLVAGQEVNLRVLESWVQHPPAEHILRVPSFAAAAEAEHVTQVLATLCPAMA